MQDSIKEFIELFEKVREAGYIRTHRTGNTGIGKTFEDVCDIVENNLDEPDFKGIEIKSRRSYASSYITLFTKAPSFPKGVNTLLREKYGTPDIEHPEMKVLHTSAFSHKFNTHRSGYGFKIEADDKAQKIYLRINNLSRNKLEPMLVYWTYADIERILTHKLKTTAVVEAKTRLRDGHEEFHFTDCTILTGLNMARFISLIRNGYIMFDIRIGVYKTGSSKGKSHDHGSGFRISRDNLTKAFDIVDI